ncbi:MAG: DUF2207 domain-containing protein [bacterium]|nr:DUF2207 domain-containing protein [bacterium]
MRRYCIIFGILFLAAFSISANVVRAEVINTFAATVDINPDSSVDVTELIVYDFGANARHGIFREIPVRYARDTGTYTLTLSDIKVRDNLGEPYVFAVSHDGANEIIRIGDPDKTVTDRHAYIISYTVLGAINYFGDHDELYWNVTGNDWEVPMGSAAAKVTYPPASSASSTCFRGAIGSTETCASTRESSTTIIFSGGALESREGLTIVIGLPKGVLTKPLPVNIASSRAKNALTKNFIWLLPIVTFFVMLYLWYKNGRDESGRGTIVPQYEPPEGLTPAGVGFIMNERMKDSDISAEIIDLARRGYILVTAKEKDALLFGKTNTYSLTRLKPEADISSEFERELMTHLFAGKASEERPTVELLELKNKFYKDMKVLKHTLSQELTTQGYFKKNPESVRSLYRYISVGVVVGAFIGTQFGIFSMSAFGALDVVGFIIFCAGGFMVARTEKGTLTKEYVLGLKDYIGTAEADRIKFHNAPAKNPKRFEELLAYAMIFGLEKEWAKQFEGIYNEPPKWYAGPAYAHGFNAGLFAGSMHDFSRASAAALISTPGGHGGSGFGGGGSSGGGMGGGGGGSW